MTEVFVEQPQALPGSANKHGFKLRYTFFKIYSLIVAPGYVNIVNNSNSGSFEIYLKQRPVHMS